MRERITGKSRGAAVPSGLVVRAGLLDHAAAAVEAVGRDAMAQMALSGLRIDRQRRIFQPGVRAVHAALGRGLAAFLNGHKLATPEQIDQCLQFLPRSNIARRSANGRCVSPSAAALGGAGATLPT